MHHDLDGGLQIVDHGGQIVSLGMPYCTFNDMVEVEGEHGDASGIIYKGPLQEYLLFLIDD